MDINTVKSLQKGLVNRATFPSSGRRKAVNASCGYTPERSEIRSGVSKRTCRLSCSVDFANPRGGRDPELRWGPPFSPSSPPLPPESPLGVGTRAVARGEWDAPVKLLGSCRRCEGWAEMCSLCTVMKAPSAIISACV